MENSIFLKSSSIYIFKVEHLNFQKNLSGKICIELDIVNVELHHLTRFS